MASRREFLLLGAGAIVTGAGWSRGNQTTSTTASWKANGASPSNRFTIGDTSYPTLAEALVALQNGQTLDIAPGIHTGEAGYSQASNITIRASGEAVFDTVYGGKSTFVLGGDNVTLHNLPESESSTKV
jgi:hypothetical protein